MFLSEHPVDFKGLSDNFISKSVESKSKKNKKNNNDEILESLNKV